ncbi:MAG: hypothetical protein NWT02_08945 [Opitutales bacterium]|nr:hypothetical protein [Opitutales bacterium]MDP4644483.1 hypothetical protein [Opitutales bacterium]MDP4777263.1 hypothetical protein [Opitutales bacterium]MDP4883487.1 hypothetical protein [Opitutales bacterium]MDP5080029.1 hypothetical protein [Opitutales bacterium]
MTSKSSRSSRSSSSRTKSSRSSSAKFIPNLTQINTAAKDLPDPEIWPEDTFLCPVMVNEKQKAVEFSRIQITRGSTRPYRWIYEGKVLIRNRDVSE